MQIDLELISGLLGGSVITIIVRELINQFNRKIDFQRDIDKTILNRKLEIAENAIAYFSTFYDKTLQIQAAAKTNLEAAKNIDISEIDFDLIDELSNNSATLLTELDGEKYYHIHSMHLYFDLSNNEFWDDDKLSQLYQCVGKLSHFSKQIHVLLSIEQNGEDLNYQEEINNSLNTYLIELENYIELLEQSKNSVLKTVSDIKSQI